MSVEDFGNLLNDAIRYYEKRDARAVPTESERHAAQQLMQSTVPARSDGTVWLFRNPHGSRDAFDGLENPWLGHRLGLKIAPLGETRLTLGFFAAHSPDPREPTFRDTSWNYLPLWDWSGRTKPLSGTPPGMDGLMEIVTVPPEIGRCNRPIRRLSLNPP